MPLAPGKQKCFKRYQALVPIRGKKILPDIMMKTVFSYWKSPVAPNPVIRVQIINGQGKSVGIASYGISPISDRVYVFGIDIDIEFQRQGYASAFLKCLAREYQLPITPIKELNSAKSFWVSVRHMTHCGLIVTQDCDMDDERKRWKYLQPEIDRLEKQILERLERSEPWFEAVGRGLD
ncbi:N-acetyltransferase [Litchfieldella anticariensis]|uniref:N-acetyltransferase n=1 Tax=Litchfieldella anticariensis TaxID=258591 RepID=UPI0004845C75|nr:N-acetyltransferase [Halomonas anticariensis]